MMNRRAIRIVICLLLGAVTTVAVAWGLAALSKSWRHDTFMLALETLPDRRRFVIESYDGLVITTHEHTRGREFTNSLKKTWYAETATSKPFSMTLKSGWPMLSVKNDGEDSPLLVKNVELPWLLRIPLWPGFLLDTIFYGLIWLGLLFSLTAARRTIRRRRGRCPLCAYDLRGELESGCPECGWNRTA